MFRQKIAQVTNCSCRLLPNQADDYMIFKPPSINAKPLIKQPKEKFSLKTQTASSTKHQNKLTSAQKTSLKMSKPGEQQKISVSGNMELRRQKIQKTLICSPENSHVRKLNQNLTHTSNYTSHHPTLPKTHHSIKTAQNNRFQQQKNPILSSYNQGQTHSHQKKNILVSNFGNNRYQNYKEVSSKMTEIPKRSLNFEEYYKHISNPYAINDRNKENAFGGGNGLKVKIDLKGKKEMRKMKNQVIPLQELHLQANSDVYGEQLGKCHGDKIGQSRANFNGSLTTKNSFNSQNSQKDSLRGSQNNMFSMMNSKVSLIGGPNIRIQNFLDAQSYQQSTQSQLITHRTPFNQPLTRKQFRNHLLTQVQAVSDDEDLNLSHITQRMNLVGNHNFASTQNPNPQPLFPINHTEVNPQKVIIQKISTLSEMMNNSAQCQSVFGEGTSSCCESNENSVVVMRYKDLIEPLEESSHFVLKPEDLLLDQKPGHEKHSQMMTDSSKVFTSVKPQGRMKINLVDDSMISANDYLKKTVKVTKEYRTHNFNLLQ